MAEPKKHRVKLYYDVISPYSYIAFETLLKYNKQWKNIDLELKPVFLGGIMQATGNKPPGLLPARERYMGRDLYRLSKFYKIPFKLPADVPKVMFEKGSLRCQRLLVSIATKCPEYLEPVSRQLYLRIWYKDLDAVSDESLTEACKDAGMPESLTIKMVESILASDVKEKLTEGTSEAIKAGAFGLPTFVADIDGKSRMFFGTDRIFLLGHYIGERWLSSNL